MTTDPGKAPAMPQDERSAQAPTQGQPRPEFTHYGMLDAQVCVPATWTDAEVVAWAGATQPCGTRNGWQIRRQGDPALNGDPERQPCAERLGFVHVVLDA